MGPPGKVICKGRPMDVKSDMGNFEVNTVGLHVPVQFLLFGCTHCPAKGTYFVGVCFICGRFVSGGIHKNARIKGFPVEHCTVTRRSMLFTNRG